MERMMDDWRNERPALESYLKGEGYYFVSPTMVWRKTFMNANGSLLEVTIADNILDTIDRRELADLQLRTERKAKGICIN